jgi:serine/threonine protein kinase
MLRGKNIWIIPLVTALLVAVVGWWADGRLHRVVRQNLSENLQSALDANVTALEIWMANQKGVATLLAEEPDLRTRALELLTSSNSPTNRMLVAERSRQLFSTGNLSERLRELGYSMANLVNTNLQVVSESGRGRGRLGQPVPEELQPKYQELFETGEPRIITPYKVPRPFGMRRGGQREGGPGPREGGQRPGPFEPGTNGVARPPMFGPGTNAATRPPVFGSGTGAPVRSPMFGFGTNAPGRGGPFEFGTNVLARRFGPLPQDPAVMQVAAPIKDSVGRTLGALVLIFNPNAEFTRILSVAGYGDTGETFAFDGEGVLLSESRFDDQLKKLGLLEDKPDTVSALNMRLLDPGVDLTKGGSATTNGSLILMVERALAGESGVEIEPFRDYRGVPVVGAWKWLPKYGFGVGMKLDAGDAFYLLRVVRSIFFVLFLLLLSTALLLLAFSYMQVRVRYRLTEAELKARQLGQYRLIEKIGEGGMGSVYRARHALLRRETALKLLPPDKADDYTIQRFEQEVQLTCALTHPNTIQVFDYGHTPDGIFYYAMEYLDGLNLHDLVSHYGPQPQERVIHIIRQVCDSLREAHERGLIHRDIKPANVFLCDRGGLADSVKVLDFGRVRHFGAKATDANLPEFVGADGIVGTPNFISPEAIENPDHADARSDIYSVGVLTYYLLTGQNVFEGESIAEVCRRHLNDTPDRPSQRTGKTFDPALEELVMRCLAKNPADRPQTAAELSAALARCVPAADWTVERRTDWWTQHRQSTLQPAHAARADSSTMERTVKIDFEERMAQAGR